MTAKGMHTVIDSYFAWYRERSDSGLYVNIGLVFAISVEVQAEHQSRSVHFCEYIPKLIQIPGNYWYESCTEQISNW